MDRLVLERAWADSYDFQDAPVPVKVKLLSQQPAKMLAAQVYKAAMKLRDEGINWYGSDFEEELIDVMNRGDAAISNPDIHISLAEYQEIVDFRENNNAVNKQDENNILEEILNLAKSQLNKKGDTIGYTMPDGNYHIFISVEESQGVDNNNARYYFVEPNVVGDEGACFPFDNNYIALFGDFQDLRKGCEWCLNEFEKDRKKLYSEYTAINNVLADATARSEENKTIEGKGKNENTINNNLGVEFDKE